MTQTSGTLPTPTSQQSHHPPVPVQLLAVAIAPYEAKTGQELSVKVEDSVIVESMNTTSEWWKCTVDGKTGYLPRSCLKLGTAPEHGNASSGSILSSGGSTGEEAETVNMLRAVMSQMEEMRKLLGEEVKQRQALLEQNARLETELIEIKKQLQALREESQRNK